MNRFNDSSLTQTEEKILIDAIEHGIDIDTNPWDMYQENGMPYRFIEAVRIIAGYYDENISLFINQDLAHMNLTDNEEKALIDWIQTGNSYYENPWHVAQENGSPYPFVEAMRIIDMPINDSDYKTIDCEMMLTEDGLPF